MNKMKIARKIEIIQMNHTKILEMKKKHTHGKWIEKFTMGVQSRLKQAAEEISKFKDRLFGIIKYKKQKEKKRMKNSEQILRDLWNIIKSINTHMHYWSPRRTIDNGKSQSPQIENIQKYTNMRSSTETKEGKKKTPGVILPNY